MDQITEEDTRPTVNENDDVMPQQPDEEGYMKLFSGGADFYVVLR